jgi:hypothetical protein
VSDEPEVLPELAIHDRFPGAWQNWSPEARALVTDLLVARCLEIHEGPAGLLKFLYAGTVRGGKIVRYMLPPSEYWRYLLEDLAERKAREAKQPEKSLAEEAISA